MIDYLLSSILWIALIILDSFLVARFALMYRKDHDKLKLMFAIGLLMTAQIYIMAIIGINTSPLTKRVYDWSSLPILFTFILILFHDRFNWSINSAYKFFLGVLAITIVLFFLPVPFPSTPILMIGVVFATLQAIIQYTKKFDISSVTLMLSMPSYAICFAAIEQNLIELAIFSGFSTKAFLILAFEIANRQSGAKSSILVLKQQLDRAEKNFYNIRNKLELNKRMAEIGELSTMVAHDLRNPLQSIATSAYFLKNNKFKEDDRKYALMVQNIEDSVNYSNKIVNEILDYSSILNLEITETTPESIINQVLSGITIPDNIVLLNNSKPKPVLHLDVNKIRRVCENLIKNAVDAMPEGGTITITSEETNDMLEISISDTGCGIPKENLKKIMTPFFTTKAKGIGLGLAICHRIIESHMGKILVESEKDHGTIFSIILPKIDIKKTNESNSFKTLKLQMN